MIGVVIRMAWLQLSHNDLDGIGCMLIGRKIGVKYNYPCGYDERSAYYFKKVLSEFKYLFNEDVTGLLITDINLTPDFIKHLEEVVPNEINVVGIDHHEDSVESHTRFKLHVDKTVCATYQMYEMMATKADLSKYHDFVVGVNAFDTWQFDTSPFGLDMQRVFYYYVFMEEEFKYVKFFKKLNNFIDLIENEPPTNNFKPTWYTTYLEKYTTRKDPLINAIMNNGKEVGGVWLYPFEKDNFAPAFEVSVNTKAQGIEHFVLIFEDKETFTLSLRTNNVDGPLMLNEFALSKNGGGHKSAASFRIPHDQDLLKITLLEVSQFYKNGG